MKKILNEAFKESNILTQLININKHKHTNISGETEEALNPVGAAFFTSLPFVISDIKDSDIKIYQDYELMSHVAKDKNFTKDVMKDGKVDKTVNFNLSSIVSKYKDNANKKEDLAILKSEVLRDKKKAGIYADKLLAKCTATGDQSEFQNYIAMKTLCDKLDILDKFLVKVRTQFQSVNVDPKSVKDYLKQITDKFDVENKTYSLDTYIKILDPYNFGVLDEIISDYATAIFNDEAPKPSLRTRVDNDPDLFTQAQTQDALEYPSLSAFCELCKSKELNNVYFEKVVTDMPQDTFVTPEILKNICTEMNKIYADEVLQFRKYNGLAASEKEEIAKKFKEFKAENEKPIKALYFEMYSGEGAFAKSKDVVKQLDLYRGFGNVVDVKQNYEVRNHIEQEFFKKDDRDVKIAICTDASYRILYVLSHFYPSTTRYILRKSDNLLFGIGPNPTKESLRNLWLGNGDTETINGDHYLIYGGISINRVMSDDDIASVIIIGADATEIDEKRGISSNDMSTNIFRRMVSKDNMNKGVSVNTEEEGNNGKYKTEISYTGSEIKNDDKEISKLEHLIKTYRGFINKALKTIDSINNNKKFNDDKMEMIDKYQVKIESWTTKIADIQKELDTLNAQRGEHVEIASDLISRIVSGLKKNINGIDVESDGTSAVVRYSNSEMLDSFCEFVETYASNFGDDTYSIVEQKLQIINEYGKMYDAIYANKLGESRSLNYFFITEYKKLAKDGELSLEDEKVSISSASNKAFEANPGSIRDFEALFLFYGLYKKNDVYTEEYKRIKKEAKDNGETPSDSQLAIMTYDSLVKDSDFYCTHSVIGFVKRNVELAVNALNELTMANNFPLRLALSDSNNVVSLRDIFYKYNFLTNSRKNSSSRSDKMLRTADEQISDEENEIRKQISEAYSDLQELFADISAETSVEASSQMIKLWDSLKSDEDLCQKINDDFYGYFFVCNSKPKSIQQVLSGTLKNLYDNLYGDTNIDSEIFEGVFMEFKNLTSNIHNIFKLYRQGKGIAPDGSIYTCASGNDDDVKELIKSVVEYVYYYYNEFIKTIRTIYHINIRKLM